MSDCTHDSAIRELSEAHERISLKNQRINELGDENVKLRAELSIRKAGTDRWLPCPDHRDKVDYRNACPECEIERLRKILADIEKTANCGRTIGFAQEALTHIEREAKDAMEKSQ